MRQVLDLASIVTGQGCVLPTADKAYNLCMYIFLSVTGLSYYIYL